MDLNNQKGQIIVESVLILVIMIGTLTLVSKKVSEMDYVKKLAVEPWARVSGMVECGSWNPCGIGNPAGKKDHPNNRVVSYDPQKE
jgi:hypothetical protein